MITALITINTFVSSMVVTLLTIATQVLSTFIAITTSVLSMSVTLVAPCTCVNRHYMFLFIINPIVIQLISVLLRYFVINVPQMVQYMCKPGWTAIDEDGAICRFLV